MDKEIVFRMTVAHIDSQQEYVNSDEIIKFYNSHLQKTVWRFCVLNGVHGGTSDESSPNFAARDVKKCCHLVKCNHGVLVTTLSFEKENICDVNLVDIAIKST